MLPQSHRRRERGSLSSHAKVTVAKKAVMLSLSKHLSRSSKPNYFRSGDAPMSSARRLKFSTLTPVQVLKQSVYQVDTM